MLYVAYHGLTLVQALFYGVGPMVIAIVARSAVGLASATVGREWPMWTIFVVVALVTLVTRAEIALLFVIAGIIGIFLGSPGMGKRPWSGALSLPVLLCSAGVVAATPLLVQLGAFFVKAGAFTFGSGLAIVPFLHQGVVLQHHWLSERQFLDAVAVGIITPGPVVITAAFVGYLVAGLPGSLIAAAGVFLPVYLFVLLIGRYIIRFRERQALKGFVKGATAAASGAIAGATVILGQGSIVDIPTAVTGAVGLLLLWRFKLPEPLLIAGAAIVGVVLYRG
jgi:chromate transporter